MYPRFSIIVPVYNVERKYLEIALNSVLLQTFDDWECLCVDDGSTDDSGLVLDEFSARDARFKVYHRSNQGVGAARNFALGKAKGEWIIFLDGDDCIAPKAFDELTKIFNQFPKEDLFRFGFATDDEETKNRHHTNIVHGPIDISKKISQDDYFAYIWQFAFRRTLISDIRFKRYKRGEDRAFLASILCLKASSYVSTDAVHYFYRRRIGSAMNSRTTVPALKDELSHRIDMICDFESCGKTVVYANTRCLEEFLVWEYMSLAVQRNAYAADDQTSLIMWYFQELKRLHAPHGLSRIGRMAIKLNQKRITPSGRRILCKALCAWYYAHSVLTAGPSDLWERIQRRSQEKYS